jgi:microcystin-dependent protein
MPNTSTKSRQALKSRFVRNAIPTEADFADLIDASLNQADDGLLKLPNEPLGLVRQQPDKPVLRFYDSPDATGSAWQIQLSAENKASADNKAGFALANTDKNGAASTLLFLDAATGNVGIGTTEANSKLQVAGTLGVTGTTSLAALTASGPTSLTSLTASGLTSLATLATTGDVGIGTNVPGSRLHIVHSNQGPDGNTLILGPTSQSNLRLGYDEAYSWIQSHGDKPLAINSVGNNVGIGTANPLAKLQITGNVSIVSAEGQNYACQSNRMAPGSLTIGGIDRNYGGGNNGRNTNIAGMLLEALDNTEIAIHDSCARLASFMYYEGAKNQFTIGRDMGSGPISTVNIQGTLQATKLQIAGFISARGVSGPINDYAKAQYTLSGGGRIRWTKDGLLSWSYRFIAICMGKTSVLPSGHFNMDQPVNSSRLTAFDNSTRIVGGAIKLNPWEAIYAIHDMDGDATKTTFQIVQYQYKFYEVPTNWILIAVVNGDDSSLKLGTGITIAPGASVTHGCPLPCGMIMMWSGQISDIPTGWLVCDGTSGTPDLRGRFVLGSGQGTGLTKRDLSAAGGREMVTLTTRELPTHSHGITDPGHKHNWTASRQEQGTDDRNYTVEFSKGDAGSVDYISKDTNTIKTGITLNNEGGSGAFDIMPPFCVLIYIMKSY